MTHLLIIIAILLVALIVQNFDLYEHMKQIEWFVSGKRGHRHVRD